MRVAPERWLEVMRTEYLDGYLPAGGSTVKVISGSDAALGEAVAGLRHEAAARRYWLALLDPGAMEGDGRRPALHRIDRLFFAITRDVDWQGWAAAQARRYLAERGLELRADRALGDLDGIAADNGRDPVDLLSQYQRELATPIVRDPQLTIEFRAAITALVRAQVAPTEAMTPSEEQVLLAWLRGETLAGAASVRKRLQIYQSISQLNARHLLASFCHWLPRTGHQGLVVVLDFRPYERRRLPRTQQQAATLGQLRAAIARRASHTELDAILAAGEEEPLYYSEDAYLKMLGMIRAFIDEIDWFERLLLVLLTTDAYYDLDSPRSYFNYDALQTRIGLEVHDAGYANPAAALVHLGDGDAG
jgi:hypothetical protein